MRKQGQVKYTAAKKVRPRSMMEQIQMLEENEEENVDFEGRARSSNKGVWFRMDTILVQGAAIICNHTHTHSQVHHDHPFYHFLPPPQVQ